MALQEEYVDINAVPTHIMTWGQTVNEPFKEETKEIVVVIPGNPGLPAFYTSFCSTLYTELDSKVPVWVVGHAGHNEPSGKNIVVPSLEGNEHLYSVQGQVKHHAEFLSRYVPKGVRVHLISHSIGAKISLELLKRGNIDEVYCYMLFPTIEHMIESRYGFLFYKVFDRIYFFLQLIYYGLNYLPLIVRTFLLYFYCFVSGFPEFILGSLIKASTPTILDKVWFMARDEMETVNEIDYDVIKQNLHRIKFYYGTTDGWVPKGAYRQLLEQFPGIDAELCTQDLRHNFVVSHGPLVGRMVSDWIKRQSVAK